MNLSPYFLQIILKDESEMVSRDTILAYLKVGSGYFGFLIVLLLLVASQGFTTFSNFWLTDWYSWKLLIFLIDILVDDK